ncbi:hypothetical protein IMZ31_24175 (plasmid) [Pontibacillus sp. ALD_SL1]|uniref:hypothetical protein n=1 Tax=Pontibacillus sp. ALD_SL1 TaxID=2777185 RepID=UPI001A9616AB|nr:hypothetical protein [Pontibacillus sp. ALD_SL1]QST02550.1 hypothetical protein IMZ31_24175 [Pontibacillus sp. ALD_SL1]
MDYTRVMMLDDLIRQETLFFEHPELDEVFIDFAHRIGNASLEDEWECCDKIQQKQLWVAVLTVYYHGLSDEELKGAHQELCDFRYDDDKYDEDLVYYHKHIKRKLNYTVEEVQGYIESIGYYQNVVFETEDEGDCLYFNATDPDGKKVMVRIDVDSEGQVGAEEWMIYECSDEYWSPMEFEKQKQ